MAPEMFFGSYSYPVDIWAFGCVVVEMLTGDFPFSNLEGQQVMYALSIENNSPLKYVDQKLPDLAEQFLNKIFKYKPEERPLAEDLLKNDSYITKTFNTHFEMESKGMLHKYMLTCKKNPEHIGFISLKDLTLQHLHDRHQNEDLHEVIKAVADLTVNICTDRISPHRPKFLPETTNRYPFHNLAENRHLRRCSGEIFALFHYVNGYTSNVNANILIPKKDSRDTTYKTCVCRKCQDSDSPSNEWYEIFVTTVTHCIFDNIEANHTTCRLFYDDEDSSVAIIDRFFIVTVYIQGDFCVIKGVTCDKALGEKLQKMCERKNVLMKQILEKYKNTEDKFCFIVSHPHGCPKHVTFGQWVDNKKHFDYNENIDLTKLSYTTATCPCSAGASVYCVGMKHVHVHSGSLRSGLNYSGIGYYYKN